jgi:flagellar basal body-associated protein FliL
MNLLMLILIFLALLIAAGVFYAAWRLSSDQPSRSRESVNDQDDVR